MASNIMLFRVPPTPVRFIIEVWRCAFAHSLNPFFIARSSDDSTVKKWVRDEPLKCNARERMVLFDASHELPRFFPSCSVEYATLFAIATLFGVEFAQPLYEVTEIAIAAE
jgi:hypothetical protein